MTARPPFFRTRKISSNNCCFRFRLDQVEDAVGDDDVDRVARDERVLDAQLLGKFVRAQKRRRVRDRPRLQLGVELLEIERQILDAAFAELDVVVTDPLRHDRRVRARDVQHLVRHVDADHFSISARRPARR